VDAGSDAGQGGMWHGAAHIAVPRDGETALPCGYSGYSAGGWLAGREWGGVGGVPRKESQPPGMDRGWTIGAGDSLGPGRKVTMEMSELHKEVARLEARQRALDAAAAAVRPAAGSHTVADVKEWGGLKRGRAGGLSLQSSAGSGRSRGRESAGSGPAERAGPGIQDMSNADPGSRQRQAAGGAVAPLDQASAHCASSLPRGQGCQGGKDDAAGGAAGAGGPRPEGLCGLSRAGAQAWLLQMAAQERRQPSCPARLADEVGHIVAWMERAAVTGDDLCSMSAADIRDELPGISLAVRKWLRNEIAAGHR